MLWLALACASRAPSPPPAVPVDATHDAPAEAPMTWKEAEIPSLSVSPTDPAFGPDDARYTVVVFVDFFCPHCAMFLPMIRDMAERTPDVRLVQKSWPIDMGCNPVVETERHRFACLAAQTAECAGRQGKFPAMADLLFANPEHVTPPELTAFAERAGMDKDAFVACIQDPSSQAAVSEDVKAGIDAGVDGTPGVFVRGLTPGGTWVKVVPSVEVLEAVLAVSRSGGKLE